MTVTYSLYLPKFYHSNNILLQVQLMKHLLVTFIFCLSFLPPSYTQIFSL